MHELTHNEKIEIGGIGVDLLWLLAAEEGTM